MKIFNNSVKLSTFLFLTAGYHNNLINDKSQKNYQHVITNYHGMCNRNNEQFYVIV